MLTGKTWATTHIRCIIIRVSIYKHGQPVEVSIVGKHRPCKETSRKITLSHTHYTLTSIPWRSLRKVSKKIARPRYWSWFPNTGPRMEVEMRWDMSRQLQTSLWPALRTRSWQDEHKHNGHEDRKLFWWSEHIECSLKLSLLQFSKHFSEGNVSMTETITHLWIHISLCEMQQFIHIL